MAADLTILHLSDLQFGRHHRYPQREKSYQTLLTKLSEDLDYLAQAHRAQPNAVVVTGDIAQTSVPDEYAQARVFLDGLMAKLKIGKERVAIVPGNHDINWDLCQGARATYKGRGKEFREPYFEKFENYQQFFKGFYGNLQAFDEAHLFQVHRFEQEQVIVVGFNSCIRESELKEDHYGWIDLKHVHEATAQCKDVDPDSQCVRIAALHHNFLGGSNLDLENLRNRDEISPSLEQARFSLVLHGHRHIADVKQLKSVKAGLPLSIVGTGSAGLDADALPDHPNQYQVIRIARRNDVTLYMRQYSAKTFGLTGEGKWTADPTLEEKEGIVTFPLDWKAAPAKPEATSTAFPDARKRFLAYMAEEHRFLPLRGFGTDLRVPLELEPVYVSLRAMPSHLEPDPRQKKRQELDRMEAMEIGPAIRFCEQSKHSGLVILGDPGSGKTTLLKYLALCLAQAKPEKDTGVAPGRIPIFLPLREVKDFNASLSHALAGVYPMSRLNLPANFFDRLLESERCLLLLDGLDEVASPERRREAGKWVEDARKAHPGHLILLTSRFAGYKGDARLPGHYFEMHVRDFSDDDVQRFVRQWYTQVETKQRGDTQRWRDEARRLADDLIRHLSREDNRSVRDLARNPLMLQIVCLVHRTQGTMPKRRTELYEECMKVLLQKWDESKGLEVFLTAAEARRVLRPLALWLHSEEGRTYADVAQVKKVLRPHLAHVKRETKQAEEQLERVLTSVRDRSGLFVGYDVARYGFQHLSFQEFLAAEEIAKTGAHERLIKTFGRSWWREPTLLALGLDDPRFQDAFFRALVRSEAFPKALDFALACVREAFAPCIKPLAEWLADRKAGTASRYNCILLLREIGGSEAVQALQQALQDPDPSIASAAQDALVKLGVLKEPRVLRASTVVNPKDSTELILIPAGEFLMGSDKGDESPDRRVYLDAYYIAKHPVTNAQYRRFVQATKHEEPWGWTEKRFNKPNQPVVGVRWEDAHAYCTWAGLRLPTEAEWEKAARGKDGRLWPWGSDLPNDKRCNFNNNVGATTEVGSYPEGASPYGCLDMAGNVWEWCQDWYTPYDKAQTRNPKGPSKGTGRVLRGGCFRDDKESVRCSLRDWYHPDFVRTLFIGFRCAQ